MKKSMYVLVLFIFIVSAVFAQEYGAGLHFSVDHYKLKGESGASDAEAKSNVFSIGGSFYYFDTNSWDYSGGLVFTRMTYEDDDYSQNAISLVGAVNKRFFSEGIFAVGLGGSAGLTFYMEPDGDSYILDDYSRMAINLAVPLTFDVDFNDSFMFRTSIETVNMYYSHLVEEFGTVEYTSNNFEMDLSGAVEITVIYKF